jgi:hypothetical protein
MSYNIDTFRLKRLENLIIPVASFYKSEKKNWHPEQPKIIAVLIWEGGDSITRWIVKDGEFKEEGIEL